MSNRIGGGWRGSGYVGTKASQPPETYYVDRDPTPFDTKPYSLLDLWLNTVTDQPWILVSLAGTSQSKGLVAQWVKFGAGDLQTLTGDDNIPVPPINFNINLHGAVGSGLVFTGNPGTATITLSTTGGGGVGQDITGDVGGSVPFDAAGNIFLLGGLGSGIVVAGNPGLNTLHITSTGGGPFGQTITGNAGGAVSPDAAGNWNVVGGVGSGLVFTGNPGTHTQTLTTSGGGGVGQTLTGDSGGAVSFTAGGNINVIAETAIKNSGSTVTIIGTPGTNTLTINLTDTVNGLTIIGQASGNLVPAGASATVGLGSSVLQNITGIAAHNVAIGNNSMQAATTARANTAVGYSTLNALTTGDSNVAVGYTALNLITTGVNNVAVGNGSLSNLTGATSNNTAVGDDSLNTASTANQNVAVGGKALFALTTSIDNVAVGYLAGTGLTTGARNVAIGSGALSPAATTATSNIAVGPTALGSLTTGQFNVASGDESLHVITTGSFNTAYGGQTGGNYTGAESSNITIGYNTPGTTGESNVCRIGLATGAGNGQLQKTFIAGIRGITTDVNDAVAVLIDSAGQLGTVSSSIRYKENVNEMGSYSDDILRLRPVTFNYKNRSSERVSVGLIAEEVGQVMPDLVVFDEDGITDTVRYHDLVPLLLNELQKAVTRIEQLERHISDIERIMLKKCS